MAEVHKLVPKLPSLLDFTRREHSQAEPPKLVPKLPQLPGSEVIAKSSIINEHPSSNEPDIVMIEKPPPAELEQIKRNSRKLAIRWVCVDPKRQQCFHDSIDLLLGPSLKRSKFDDEQHDTSIVDGTPWCDKHRPSAVEHFEGNEYVTNGLIRWLAFVGAQGENMGFYLQGALGCGKTSIARAVALKCGYEIFDLEGNLFKSALGKPEAQKGRDSESHRRERLVEHLRISVLHDGIDTDNKQKLVVIDDFDSYDEGTANALLSALADYVGPNKEVARERNMISSSKKDAHGNDIHFMKFKDSTPRRKHCPILIMGSTSLDFAIYKLKRTLKTDLLSVFKDKKVVMGQPLMRRALERILKAEGVTMDSPVLEQVMNDNPGNFRRAIMELEMASARGRQTNLSFEDIHRVNKILGYSETSELHSETSLLKVAMTTRMNPTGNMLLQKKQFHDALERASAASTPFEIQTMQDMVLYNLAEQGPEATRFDRCQAWFALMSDNDIYRPSVYSSVVFPVMLIRPDMRFSKEAYTKVLPAPTTRILFGQTNGYLRQNIPKRETDTEYSRQMLQIFGDYGGVQFSMYGRCLAWSLLNLWRDGLAAVATVNSMYIHNRFHHQRVNVNRLKLREHFEKSRQSIQINAHVQVDVENSSDDADLSVSSCAGLVTSLHDQLSIARERLFEMLMVTYEFDNMSIIVKLLNTWCDRAPELTAMKACAAKVEKTFHKCATPMYEVIRKTNSSLHSNQIVYSQSVLAFLQ